MTAYKFLPTLLLRTPALSYKSYCSEDLTEFLQTPFFLNAVYLASKTFYAQLKKARFSYELLDAKAISTLSKYANRMCFRPTPFGIFSAFSAVSWGNDDKIVLGEFKVHFKKSFEETINFAQANDVQRKPADLIKANQTIYQVGNEYRYLTSKPSSELKGNEFMISSVGVSDFLRALLKFTAKKRPYSEITEFISAYGDVDMECANTLFEELIELQFVVSDQMPNITGVDYMERILGLNSFTAPLNGISESDRQKITSLKKDNNNENVYFDDLLPATAKDHYVNLEKISCDGSLNVKYQKTILDALDCLIKLSANYSRNYKMAGFVKAFNQKFDTRAIPLLYALDPETGVGYDDLAKTNEEKPLTSDISWQNGDADDPKISWTGIHNLLLEKVQAGTSNARAITITDDDLAKIKVSYDKLTLPPSVSVMFRIINDKVFIEHAGGITASGLIGRFTPLNGQIHDLANAIAAEEQKNNPGVIFAEIAHICEYYTANINRRLSSYDYEIPVLTNSIISENKQLPLSDLWISVINNNIVLQSKKHKTVVIPRLSSAFNHTRNNLSIFRFLCDLQYQAINSYWELDLKSFFPDLNYYPRVEYKGAILQVASWHIVKEIFEPLQKVDSEEKCGLFNVLKERLKLPDCIALTVGDNQLVFDLRKHNDILFFIDTTKNLNIVVKEFIPAEGADAIVEDENGNPYINQFVTSLYQDKAVYSAHISPISKLNNHKRAVLPGTDWLYFKIYCHAARSNEIIADKLLPLTQKMQVNNNISSWFFIRYQDPEYHIRFRVKHSKKKSDNSFAEVTGLLNQLVKKKWIQNYQISIYERELERYSAALIEEFENVFYDSSKLVAAYYHLALINEIDIDNIDFAFITVRDIINTFNLDRETRISFLTAVYEGFCAEFKVDAKSKHQFDTKFRSFRKKMDDALTEKVAVPGKTTLGKYNTELLQSLTVLQTRIKKRPMHLKLKWLGDLIHMHLNRLFVEDSRRQEFVVYFLLMKHEKSALAKQASNGKN
jgi:thiopeptide-type bacteriocin biosynthesis protein